MLARLEAGETRITGLDDRQTDETFETEFTARQNPYRGYITIIEGCDKFCSYCVVPYTRGKERSRTSSSVLDEAKRIADLGYTEIQLLGQNVNSYRDPKGSRASRNCWQRWARFAASGACDLPRAIREILHGTLLSDRSGADALRPRSLADTVGGRRPCLSEWPASTRRSGIWNGLRGSRRRNGRFRFPRILLLDFPGETDDDFIQTMNLLGEVQYDCVFAFKYSARPNTPSLTMIDTVPDEEKGKRLQVLLERQREIQRANYSKQIGEVIEVMVEGAISQRGQISARSTQNKPVNITWTQPIAPAPGSYLSVRVTAAFPNSLVGEAV